MKKNGLFGLLNSEFETIQEIKYDKIEISDEFFIFSKNNLYGIMNCDGRIILDEFYTAISSYDYSYDTKLFKITNEGYVGIWDAINK